MALNDIVKQPKNDGRSRQFFGVLNFPHPEEYRKYYFNMDFCKLGGSFEYYAYILHDRDKKQQSNALVKIGTSISDPDFEMLKTPHIHFLLVSPNRRRKDAVLKEIAACFEIPLNCVSLEVASSIPACIQYRTHFNLGGKYQYPITDIHTNNQTWLYRFCLSETSSFTAWFVRLVERSGGDYSSLILEIGLERAKKYNWIIYNIYRLHGWL